MTRKEEIVRTCMDIFSESGVQGLTMKAIADRVRITEPAIYRHFRNKEAVLVAMITQIREEIFRRVDEVAHRPIDAVEKLREVFGHHLAYLKRRRAITLELLSESFFHHHPEVRRQMRALLRDYHEKIRGIVADGVERGELPERAQPEAVSILFLGALQHLLTMFKLENDESEIDNLSEKVFHQFKTVLEGGVNP